MSLEKAIKHGKEHRKHYYNSGSFDYSCRPGGGCPYCEQNRKFSTIKAKMKASQTEQENEYFGGYNIPGPEDAMMDFEAELYKKVGSERYESSEEYEEPEDWSLD